MLSEISRQAKAAYQRGDWVEAEQLCQHVLREKSNDFDALNLLGIISAQKRQPQEAIELLSKAITVSPNRAIAHSNLGNLLLGLGQFEQALDCFDRALDIEPIDADILYNRSSVLGSLGRYEEALKSCDRALAVKPDFAEALNVRGNALGCLNRPVEALECFERALKINPNYAEALNNQGVVLTTLQRRQEALASLELALEIKPNYADARWNIAPFYLQLGDFTRGWEGYEWRWGTVDHSNVDYDFSQPLWLGAESLEGKTLLLHSEQGYGDTLQFCRYVRQVAAKGATVMLEVQPPLQSLLADLEGADRVLPKGAVLPAFDYHCPLLSLPLAFKTALETIPADIPYIHSDAARVAVWETRLGKKSRPRVGLTWSGNPGHKNDRNRSVALAALLPLLQEEIEWISLQQEVRNVDADVMMLHKGIRHFGQHLRDFSDTAALVECVDLVVSVDTSVVHLAGAMGKEVWILLPFNPDWRWLLNREDSPWYPTVRLFRQSVAGDWESVIDRTRKELVLRYPDLCIAAPTAANADHHLLRSRRAPENTLAGHAQDYSQSPIAGNTPKLLIYLFLVSLAIMTIWLLLS